MNYCPNCGYHLAKLKEELPAKTQFPPPGSVFFPAQQRGILSPTIIPEWCVNKNHYTTTSKDNLGAFNGTKTSTKG